jgi:hypothetical protein
MNLYKNIFFWQNSIHPLPEIFASHHKVPLFAPCHGNFSRLPALLPQIQLM